MKQCDKDKTPCLHEACLMAQNIKCCSACEFSKDCTTACFKVKGLKEND